MPVPPLPNQPHHFNNRWHIIYRSRAKRVEKVLPKSKHKSNTVRLTPLRKEVFDTVVNDSAKRLEDTVKTLLQERYMSMRKLAALTGINVATISKMLTGKQRVNPEYLQRIAHCLGVHPEVLFAAAGFEIGAGATEARNGDSSVKMIQEILDHLKDQTQHFTKWDIEQELTKYETYVMTEEGQEMIREKFPDKRREIVGAGPFVGELDEIYRIFSQEDISMEERCILGSVLWYFVLSTDVIPDYLFPIGYLDDALAVQIARERLSRFYEQHRNESNLNMAFEETHRN